MDLVALSLLFDTQSGKDNINWKKRISPILLVARMISTAREMLLSNQRLAVYMAAIKMRLKEKAIDNPLEVLYFRHAPPVSLSSELESHDWPVLGSYPNKDMMFWC